MAYSPDGQRLAVGYNHAAVKIWETHTGRELLTLQGHSRHVRGVAFSPDGQTLASAGAENVVKLWNLSTGQEIATLTGFGHYANTVAFTLDGQFLLAGSRDNTWRVWEVATRRQLMVVESQATWVNTLALSPDGKTLATGNGGAPSIKLWDVATGNEKFYSMAFTPDGNKLMTGGSSVRFWDAGSGQEITALPNLMEGNRSPVLALACSFDGKRLAITDGRFKVKVLDAFTGQEYFQLTDTSNYISSVSFSPDGKKLLTGSRGAMASGRIWDGVTGQQLVMIPGDSHAAAFSPDGRVVAVGVYISANLSHTKRNEFQLILADSATGERIRVLADHSDAIYAAAFSPEGKRLAVGCGDGTVKLWEVSTGREIARLTGHGAAVKTLAFSPDGSRLATAGQEGLVRLWDITLGIELLALRVHTDEVTAVAFSPDGRSLASTSLDGTVRFWRAATPQEVAARRRQTTP